MEVGVRIPEAVLRQTIETLPEQEDLSKYERTYINNFQYKGINPSTREVVMEFRSRYHKLIDNPTSFTNPFTGNKVTPIGGEIVTLYDNAANVTMGLNLEIVDQNLKANARPKKSMLIGQAGY